MEYESFFYRVARFFWWNFCRILPINKKKIFLSSYYGNGYSDNLKYIANELLKDDDFEIVWSCKGKKEAETLPEGIKPSYCGSFEWVYQLSTSAMWIDNCRKAFRFKKNTQFYIQTYHGTGAGKKCEKDVENKLSRGYVEMAIKDGRNTDLMISPDAVMTKHYKTSFWYDGPVYQIGFPRMDVLFKKDKTIIKERVCDFFNLSINSNFILYAPTFRSDFSFKAYDVDFKAVLTVCKSRFGKEFIMLIHLHPNVANSFSKLKYGNNVLNATPYPDMQELLAVSDILIGDYSSVNHEFSVTKKPVFLFATDIDEYKKDRDFYLPLDQLPFPLAKNNDELLKNIINFDYENYLRNLSIYHKKLGVVFNRHSAIDCATIIRKYFELGNDKEKFFKEFEGVFI